MAISDDGYEVIRWGDRTVRLHRLIAQTAIGRALLPGEEVHHRNGDKLDNRIENLVVMPNRAAHMAEHRKIACIHGHPLAGENVYVRRDTGQRQCKECKRQRVRAWRIKHAA